MDIRVRRAMPRLASLSGVNFLRLGSVAALLRWHG
jgi:hypothetical protein